MQRNSKQHKKQTMQEDVNIYMQKKQEYRINTNNKTTKYTNLQEYTKIIPKYTKVYKKQNTKYQKYILIHHTNTKQYFNPLYKYQRVPK